MAGDPIQPLSTEASAVHEAGLRAWVHHSPWGFMALALGGGYLAGRMPVVRTSLMWTLARTMLTLTHK